MKKFVLGLLLILGLAACGDVQTSKAEKKGKPVVKIGVTLPLTGDVAFGGIAAQKALDLALADVKKARSLKYDYQLVFENDRMDPKQAFSNLKKFESFDKVNAVVSMWLISPVISEYVNSKKLLHLGCSWGHQTAQGLYNFNHSTFHEEQTEILLDEFAKKKIKKVGIISNNTQVGVEILGYLRNSLAKAQVDVVFDMVVNPSEKDFRTAIDKMKQKEADAVLVFLLSPGMEIFSKQAKEKNYQIPFVTFNNFSYHPEYWEGQWFIADAEGTPEFKQYFKTQTGVEVQSCSVNLYDGLRLMIEAYEKAPVSQNGIPDNKSVAETILKTKNFESAAGAIRIDKEGNIHAFPSLAKIENGKVKILKE